MKDGYKEILKEVNGGKEPKCVDTFDRMVFKIAGNLIYATNNNGDNKAGWDVLEKITKKGKIKYYLLGSNNKAPDYYYWGKRSCWSEILTEGYNNKNGDYKIEDNTNYIAVLNQVIGKRKKEKLGNLENEDFSTYGITRCKYEDRKNLIERIRRDLGLERLERKLRDVIKEADCKQIICHGAPGTGKTYVVENLIKENKGFFAQDEVQRGRHFVQFHPSYDYTDFVEGLRPAKLENGNTSFVRMDGIFKEFCRKVVDKGDKGKKYLFIIDEINRADLAKVFGELMYCFEDTKRGEEHRITTQYANTPCYEMVGDYAQRIDKDRFKDGFFIPENVVVIGTMNDIDRSVESFDFALQRRFQWIKVDAKIEMTEEVLKAVWRQGDTKEKLLTGLSQRLREHAKQLNNVIEEKLGSDYMIGHAYYKKFAIYYQKHDRDGSQEEISEEAFKEALDTIWNYSLESIITSYCRGKNLKKDDLKAAFLNDQGEGKSSNDQSEEEDA